MRIVYGEYRKIICSKKPINDNYEMREKCQIFKCQSEIWSLPLTFFVDIPNNYPRAQFCKIQGYVATNTASSACDKYHLPGHILQEKKKKKDRFYL